jgi:rare lipoprotein A
MAAKTLRSLSKRTVVMRQHTHTLTGRAGGKAAASDTTIKTMPACARTLLILPASLLLIASTGVFAASINPEAAAPQRTTPAQTVARPAPRPAATLSTNTTPAKAATTASRAAPVSAAASATAPRPLALTPNARPVVRPVIATQLPPPAPRPIQAIRQVSVPVLGREGPAAAAGQAPVRQIAITASEPELTSGVRTSDVAAFQKIGAPYQVGGTWYVPAHEPDYDETGVASWYGNEFQGKPTANGEIFDMNVVSGAHPTLPIPSLVEVTNLANGRSIIVRINDRGPFVGSRLIDMSARGAQLLGFREQGHTNVRVRYVGPADAEPRVTQDNLTPSTQLAANMATKPLPANAAPPALPPVRAVAETVAPVQASQQAFVQVGAFSQIANAQRLRDQAASLGPVQVVEATNSEGAPLYRVVLGPIANRAEALAKVEELNNNGIASARVMASLN